MNTKITSFSLQSFKIELHEYFLKNVKFQAHCPNLELLDLSNVTTIAASHGILHIEKLQGGCQKLKVLRITNSHITLSPSTLQEQVSHSKRNLSDFHLHSR